MTHPNSPHTPEEKSNTTPIPIGFNPEGWPIVSADELPTLPIPTSVEVSNRHISIDGWNFPYVLIKKPMLEWLRQSFIRWMDEDLSDKNKQRINAIAETFQKGISRQISTGQEYPTIQL